MPKIGCLGKIIIGLVIILALFGIGLFLFPVPEPHIVLPADEIFHIGGFPVTNTLLATWVSIGILVLVFALATRKMKLIPTGLQNVVETIVEMLFNFVVGIAGDKNGRRFFPVIASIFLFVIVNALMAMLPGFHTIGFGHHGEWSGAFAGHYEGFLVEHPLLRKASTDANFPLAVALFTGVFGWFWGLKIAGPRAFFGEFIRAGSLVDSFKLIAKGKVGSGLGGMFTGIIDLFIGFIEFLSHLVRVVSFTFRLFGNMTAGEVLVMMMAFLFTGVVVPIFYGLELILGFVQAIIFAGLTLVWTSMMSSHDSEH